MRKLIIAAALLLGASPAFAQNYQATQGSGTTFGTKLVGGVNYPQWVLCDPTTPANCGKVQAGNAAATTDLAVTVSDPNVLAAINAAIPSCGATPCTNHIGAVEVASGGVASGAFASGSVASGAIASGAIASGAVASGAFSSGSIGSGAIASGAIASGAYATGSFSNVAATKAASTAPAAADLAVVVNQSPNTADPCSFANAKTNFAISTASGTFALVTGVSAKKIYICSLSLIATTAVSVSLAEGSSSTCGTSNQAAVIGVATNGTAANGMALAANGGLTLGNGGGTIAITATAANYLCLFQSGTAQIAGNITYVQQ